MVHEVQLGKRSRMSFSKIDEVLEMPNLIEVQKKSYQRFLEVDLREVLRDVSPITGPMFSKPREEEADENAGETGNVVRIGRTIVPNVMLEFLDYSLKGPPKYSIQECKNRDATYSAPLKVMVRLVITDKKTGEVQERTDEVFMGDFPLMTEHGSFIINGAERVIVSQLVRSPGMYYKETTDKNGKKLFSSQVIPNRGAWLEYETDSNDIMWVRVDRTRKLPLTVILRAFGLGTDAEIMKLFGQDERLQATVDRDNAKTAEEGLLEVYRRLRPGEPPTVESATSLLQSLFFDPKRYDLARVGRYKFNKKLSIATRAEGFISAKEVVDPNTGELLIPAGERVDYDQAKKAQNAGVNEIFLTIDGKEVKVLGNHFADPSELLGFDIKTIGLNENIHYPVLQLLLAQMFLVSINPKASVRGKFQTPQEELEATKSSLISELKKAKRRDFTSRKDMTLTALIQKVVEIEGLDAIKKEMALNSDQLMPKRICVDDVMGSVSYLIGLAYGIGHKDDIDHLGNRRLRSVGELLQNQIRIGLSRLERVVKERMAIQDLETARPQSLINIRPVSAAIKEFFGSSQLSQFMDQLNPLAELTHKRRLSALGPGGLNRERASFEVRDVHHSHYGRMCPIETPEGPNIGLIGSLSTYARINEYGFIESPYRCVDKKKKKLTDKIVYLTADEEDRFVVAQANEPLDENGFFLHERVTVRVREEIIEVNRDIVDLMDVSPRQVVSVATSMIPFLENDDANRALMGSNMQRQAVPLLKPQAPIVGTGMEYKAARDSGVVLLSHDDGVVEKVSSREIIVKEDNGNISSYSLQKFVRSNQGTCINQRPVVKIKDRVEKDQVLADGPSTDQGEIALGRNILIGFMTWEGYNYEDAILISEKLVKEDIFTSIHIDEYECEARDTKLGPEEITRDIPNIGDDALKDLDDRGIIRVGAEVRAGDILVGKVTPKGETELTAEERLLRAIFGEKAREVRDTSLRVPHGEGGIVVDVKVFTRENKDELSPGTNCLVRVYIAQKRKISVGDKMAGRHGNKGVISRILPEEDMPFLPDGTPLEIVLNPLGVPSRMNIGQVLEVHLGLAAKSKGWHVATPVFDGATEGDIVKLLQEEGFASSGKTVLYDGRSGETFENPVTVGYMYIMKLAHLVDDKIHARSTGPYSLVTQQPLGGKAQFGGQRFGEMEVWALEAYGAAHTLQEILTVKSDDVIGRVKTYEAIVKGENVPEPGVPESLKVLIKELQSLSLDVRILAGGNLEVPIRESVEDELHELNVNIEGTEDEISLSREDLGTEEDLGDLDLGDIENIPDIDDFADELLDDEEE